MSARGWLELYEAEWKEIAKVRAGAQTTAKISETEDPEAPVQRAAWPPAWKAAPPENETFGLALSGGGIRSATFNLGLLQELDRFGFLRHFDYMSTVSGGGYMGGFWSAWRARKTMKKNDSTAATDELFPGSEPSHDRPEPPEIRHLREFSNFLRPRASLLSLETARIVGALVGGVFPCVAIAFSFLTMALAVWLGMSALVASHTLGAIFSAPLLPGIAYFAYTLVPLLFLERRVVRRTGEKTFEGFHRVWAVTVSVVAGLLGMGLWYLAASPVRLLSGVRLEQLGPAMRDAFLPALPWLVLSVLLVGARIVVSGVFQNDWIGRAKIAAIDRIMVRLFLTAAIWFVVSLAWVAGQMVAEIGVSGVVGALSTGTAAGSLFAWLRGRFFSQTNVPAGAGPRHRMNAVLYQALAYLALTAVIAASAAQLVLAYTGGGFDRFLLFLGVILVVFLVGMVVDPHEIGLHRFYRARLVRAYLGASNDPDLFQWTDEARGDDVGLACLPSPPLHLICCAANDLSGDSLRSLNRGAAPAVASKVGLQVGDIWRPWCLDHEWPWLSDVLTASGAAFNSHMGHLSTRFGHAVTFLLAALGLRLGLWTQSPTWNDPDDWRIGWFRRGLNFIRRDLDPRSTSREDGDGPPEHSRDTSEHDSSDARCGDLKAPREALLRRAPGYLFVPEMLGRSRADAKWIHLSDGAHFENLALYELVRRHCRFILLSDCGSDPERTFDDFGNAVRRIREDFGVEIEIDISPLKPDADRRSRQPMVAGDIHYPPAGSGEPGDTGILLYVKPTIIGDEPPDVTQYQIRNQAFPHESTIDQFYDEAQWESYRRLGRHAVKSAFEPLQHFMGKKNDPLKKRYKDPTLVFQNARFYWPPIPTREDDLEVLEKQWIDLVTSIHAPGFELLREQVTLVPPVASATKLPEPASPPPEEEAYLTALPKIQIAVRIMEALYLRTAFGATPRSPSHQRFIGWYNRLGIWASAPIFRAWWPWIAPFRSGRFNSFMEIEFGLDTQRFREGTITKNLDVSRPKGFAMVRWGETADPPLNPPPKGSHCFGYQVHMGRRFPKLDAALVRFVDESPADARSTPPVKKVAKWWRDDFYVPPGLWNLSIGPSFLRELLHELRYDGYTHAVLDLTPRPTEENPEPKPTRLSSAWATLYTAAGFRRVRDTLERDLAEPLPSEEEAGSLTT